MGSDRVDRYPSPSGTVRPYRLILVLLSSAERRAFACVGSVGAVVGLVEALRLEALRLVAHIAIALGLFAVLAAFLVACEDHSAPMRRGFRFEGFSRWLRRHREIAPRTRRGKADCRVSSGWACRKITGTNPPRQASDAISCAAGANG